MTDRVFPSSKPQQPTATNVPPPPAAATANGNSNGISKPQAYNPSNRPIYRPQPYSRHHHHQSRPSCRRICCCCCFWSILIILILALIAAIAGTAVYVIYHPRPPIFTVPSLRISRVNLTISSDSTTSHLASFFNFTLTSENPNSHLSFAYDPFLVTVRSVKSGEDLGNGTVPAFYSDNGNKTTFKGVIASHSVGSEVDLDVAKRLRSDLAKPKVRFEIEMETKVKLQMGKLKSEGVVIKVKCGGFESAVPRGKTPVVAVPKKTKCKSDLRVKIWKWSF